MSITINNMSFYYEGSYQQVFDNVNLNLDTKWKLGLVGRNGRGKTTFLNILRNKLNYTGTISSTVVFDYFPIEVNSQNDIVLDIIKDISNIYEYDEWKIFKEANLIELKEDVLYREYNTLSGGERVKVMFISLFLKENKFLLIDEPTNHLDIKGREVVSNYLSKKQGFILVSHDQFFIDNCVDHILSINKSTIEINKGNYSTYIDNKNRRNNHEVTQNDRLHKEIQGLNRAISIATNRSSQLESSKGKGEYIDKGFIGAKSASVAKSAKVMQNRIQKNIEEKSLLLKDIETIEPLKFKCIQYRLSKLITVNDLSVTYDKEPLFSNKTFEISNNNMYVISGTNGSGKSTIVKAILNKISYDGYVNIHDDLIISYVSQDVDYLHGSLSDYIYSNQIDEVLFKSILRKLDFSRDMFEKDISTYSQGQKKKVLIAASLSKEAHLYIWDEPFNYIDIYSRKQLLSAIQEFNPTMIVIEHDRTFLDNITYIEIRL